MAKKHQCTTHGLDCDWTATSEDTEELVQTVKEARRRGASADHLE